MIGKVILITILTIILIVFFIGSIGEKDKTLRGHYVIGTVGIAALLVLLLKFLG